VLVPVPSWAFAAQITASGLWRHDPFASLVGPDGIPHSGSDDSGYISATIGSDLLTPISCEADALVGFFDLPGRNGVETRIGSLLTFPVPAGARNLVFGFHDSSGWSNNDGSVSVKVVFQIPP